VPGDVAGLTDDDLGGGRLKTLVQVGGEVEVPPLVGAQPGVAVTDR